MAFEWGHPAYRCPACDGMLLYGGESPRCPDCGRTWSEDELAAAWKSAATTVDRPRDPEDGFDGEGRPADPWPDEQGGTSGLDGSMPRRIDGTLPFPVAGLGDCYEAAGKALIQDELNTDQFGNVPSDEVTVVHGRMTSPPIGGHAWLEARGHVYDLSNGRVTYMPIDEYYREFGIKDVHKYTRSEAFQIMLKLKQWGPWDDDPRLNATAAAVPPCPCECSRGEFCGGCGHRGCGMRRERPAGYVPPCPCECNRGEFCGGCGHAGCGGRRSKKASREPFITDLGPEIGSTVLPDGGVLGRYGVWAWDESKGKYQVVDTGEDLTELQRKHGVPDSDVTQIRGATRTANKEETVELSHLIGAKDEAISFLPALPAVKEARRDFSYSEKSALIEEAPDRRARNQGKLDLAGTHYVSSTPEELDDLTNPLFW